MAYSLPTDVFLLLEEAFNQDRAKAQVFARAIEGSIQAIETQVEQRITDKKENLKSELYNELRTELATKEFVRAEINELRAEIRAEISELRTEIHTEINKLRAEINAVRLEVASLRSDIKQNSMLLKILIGLAIFGLTLFNPAFVKLVELIMK
ncbi:MAG: hypothetical protein Q8N96_04380 [Methylovulum sp.]|nr:hypothetical protein [Methylovulum sp.]